jgi:hypothetical protein
MRVSPGTRDRSLIITITDGVGVPQDNLDAATAPALYIARGNGTAKFQIKYTGWASGPALVDLASETDDFTQGGIYWLGGGGRYRLDPPETLYDTDGTAPQILTTTADRDVYHTPIDVQWRDEVIQSGTARNGPSSGDFQYNSLRLAASEPGQDVTGKLVRLVRGTGAPDSQVAISYGTVDGLTSVLKFGRGWFNDTPDGSTEYEILNTCQPSLVQNARAAADLQSINDDTTGAQGLESTGVAVNDNGDSIGAAVMAGFVEEALTLKTVLQRLNGLAHGLVSSVDNGNGTVTLTVKAEDGTTTLFSRTYNPTTGART